MALSIVSGRRVKAMLGGDGLFGGSLHGSYFTKGEVRAATSNEVECILGVTDGRIDLWVTLVTIFATKNPPD